MRDFVLRWCIQVVEAGYVGMSMLTWWVESMEYLC